MHFNARFKITLLIGILIILLVFSFQPIKSTPNFSSTKPFISVKKEHWKNWSRDRNHNKIDDLIEFKVEKTSYKDQDSISVFVHYDHKPNVLDVENLESLNVTISYTAKFINTICVRNLSFPLVQKIADLPGVVMVELQPRIYSRLDISVRAIKVRESSFYSPNTVWDLGYTGNNVVVAVLDTGVDDEHEFLKGKFVAGFDCSGVTSVTDRETNPDDEDGHGTHVASIIMGTGGSAGQYIGVAPSAMLVDVKVLSKRGVNLGDQLIRGIEWVIENKDKYNIKVINLSVGSDIEDPDGTSAISQAANTAVESGLVVVAAAGNEGPEEYTLCAPAVADNVICVTALDDRDTVSREDDVIASYSSRGPRLDGAKKPDVCAPGTGIVAAKGEETGEARNEVVVMSGTSMAAPHVSGLAALILDANPTLSPFDVKRIILDTAEDKGSEGWDSAYGWGEIDAYEAVLNALGESEVNQPPEIYDLSLNSNQVFRVWQSIVFEVHVGDDRTPANELEVIAEIKSEFGYSRSLSMDYEGNGIWRLIYTPNATTPIGNYTISVEASDGEGRVTKSDELWFVVLNNPPSILQFSIELEVMKHDTLSAWVQVFDYEGLPEAKLCLKVGDSWKNYTGVLKENGTYTFNIDVSKFPSDKVVAFFSVYDSDGAEVVSNQFMIVIYSEIPTLLFLGISMGVSALITFIVALFLFKFRRR